MSSDPPKPCPYCGIPVTGSPHGCTGLFKEIMTAPAESALDELPPEARPFESDETRKLNDYILVEQIGKGGMGTVWKAWDRKLTRWVAIKFLLVAEDEDVLRFQREAKLAARLRHPNIAPIYEVGEAPATQAGQQTRHYLCMEYIDGSTMAGLDSLIPGPDKFKGTVSAGAAN